MTSNKQLVGLDIIRFLAALLVMAFHLGFAMWTGAVRRLHEGGADTTYHWLAPFTWFGWIGVEVFFVLSGFVIAYSADGATAGKFLRGRLIRLYPMAWVCSTLTLLAVLASGETLRDNGWAWLRAFLLSPKGQWIDGAYWTLGVELGFYVVIFLLLKGGFFHRVGAVMTAIGIASSAASVVCWAAMRLQGSGGVWASYAFRYRYDWRWGFLLVPYGSFFAIGTLLWLSLFRTASPRRLLALAVCIAGGLAEIIIHTAEVNTSAGFNFPVIVPITIWLLTLVAIVCSVKHKGTITQALGTQGAILARTLGLMTYPLYLLHQRAGYILIRGGRGNLPDIVSLGFVMLLLLGTAYFMSMYPDKMLQKHLRTLVTAHRSE